VFETGQSHQPFIRANVIISSVYFHLSQCGIERKHKRQTPTEVVASLSAGPGLVLGLAEGRLGVGLKQRRYQVIGTVVRVR